MKASGEKNLPKHKSTADETGRDGSRLRFPLNDSFRGDPSTSLTSLSHTAALRLAGGHSEIIAHICTFCQKELNQKLAICCPLMVRHAGGYTLDQISI